MTQTHPAAPSAQLDTWPQPLDLDTGLALDLDGAPLFDLDAVPIFDLSTGTGLDLG